MFLDSSIRNDYKPILKLGESFDFDKVNNQKKLINGTEIVNHVI
jgi:hypothetical protein